MNKKKWLEIRNNQKRIYFNVSDWLIKSYKNREMDFFFYIVLSNESLVMIQNKPPRMSLKSSAMSRCYTSVSQVKKTLTSICRQYLWHWSVATNNVLQTPLESSKSFRERCRELKLPTWFVVGTYRQTRVTAGHIVRRTNGRWSQKAKRCNVGRFSTYSNDLVKMA